MPKEAQVGRARSPPAAGPFTPHTKQQAPLPLPTSQLLMYLWPMHLTNDEYAAQWRHRYGSAQGLWDEIRPQLLFYAFVYAPAVFCGSLAHTYSHHYLGDLQWLYLLPSSLVIGGIAILYVTLRDKTKRASLRAHSSQ